MREIEDVTCIKFQEQSKNLHQELVLHNVKKKSLICFKISKLVYFNTLLPAEPRKKDFIKFVATKRSECHSRIGREGGGQMIVLSGGCAKEHILIHEVFISIIIIYNY